MARFFVLHLSDLHICSSITNTLSNLIDSIIKNKELQNNNLIIAITGDIINRANYSKYQNTVLSFFTQFKTALQKSNINVCDIVIVPGNHDKKTEAANKLFSIAQQSGVEFNNDTKSAPHMPTEKQVIDLQCKGFRDHITLCNKIFKIFEIKDKTGKPKTYTTTFGVEKITINESDILFVRLNTAVSCYGKPCDGEKYRLTLGQYQLDTVLKEYEKLKATCKPNSLTLGLAHHPISYMTSKEASKINKYLISEDLLCIDYFLSGHIHDGSLTNLSNHNRNMLSLETGIGWPDDPESSHKDHRYALYCFDNDKNVFFSCMYKTNKANVFSLDTDYLLTNKERENGKIYNPLKTRDYAFIELNNFCKDDKQYLFVDSDSIDTLKLLFSTISDFSSFCSKLLPTYLNGYIDSMLSCSSTFNELHNGIIDIFNKTLSESTVNRINDNNFENFINSTYALKISNNEEILHEVFLGYLQHICDNFHGYFKEYFDSDSECRAVFRIYSKETDSYVPICASPANSKPRSKYKTNPEGSPRIYNYEKTLIKHAFENGKSLVYSINAEKNAFKPDNWDDFIVMVPNIESYEYIDADGKNCRRPSVSFVFSVRLKDQKEDIGEELYNDRLKKQAHRLFLLQFSEVEKIISTVIAGFLQQMPINIKDFIDKNKTVKSKGEQNK